MGLYKTQLRLSDQREDQKRAIEYIKGKGDRSLSDYITEAVLHYEETILPEKKERILGQIEKTIRETLRKEWKGLSAGFKEEVPEEEKGATGHEAEWKPLADSEKAPLSDAAGRPGEDELPKAAKDFLRSLSGGM